MNSVTVGDHILDIYDFPLADGKFTFTADRDTFTLISSVSTHTRQGGKLIRSYLISTFYLLACLYVLGCAAIITSLQMCSLYMMLSPLFSKITVGESSISKLINICVTNILFNDKTP